jgi:hypothetical protein
MRRRTRTWIRALGRGGAGSLVGASLAGSAFPSLVAAGAWAVCGKRRPEQPSAVRGAGGGRLETLTLGRIIRSVRHGGPRELPSLRSPHPLLETHAKTKRDYTTKWCMKA